MLADDPKLTEDIKTALKALVDHADREDRIIRERQIRLWRKLKLYWDGFQRLWFSETAHDWRIGDTTQGANEYASYYDKPINVFRSYLESIIAALSVTVPAIKCYPDDADNRLDIETARAGDKIADLVYKHNDATLLWIRALYIFCTEGMIAAYRYTKEDKKYGTYEENVYEDREEELDYMSCPTCETELIEDNFCPECMEEVGVPIIKTETIQNSVLVGKNDKPKSRQCIEIYGGLYVKVPSYAMKPEDCPYLIWAYETHYSQARARYSKANIHEGNLYSSGDYYERWGRTSTQYMGDEPENNVTVRNTWVRPSFYHILDEAIIGKLNKLFPSGAKIVMVDDKLCEVEDEDFDEHWTLTRNPLSDYLIHEPTGLLLVNIQEITNDLIALVLQTIEAGIPQTFADPKVLNFNAYNKVESTPGLIFPATGRSGQGIGDGFHEIKTATLSREIEPFMQRIQEFGQLVSGALPSLFGGQAAGSSRTAAEYSMSRAQALQRLQTNWKMLTIWWKDIFSKVIPAYIENVVEDEKMVEKDELGNFVNIFIRKVELEGKIGRIELEASEHLPATFGQKKDVIMEIVKNSPPDSPLLAALMSPENITLLGEAVGLQDFTLPNQNDIEKQHEEIQLLLESGPFPDEMLGEVSSIPIEPEIDNHLIESETLKRWAVSPAGRAAKRENPNGYRNALLHLREHLMAMQPEVPNEAMPQAQGQPESEVNENGNGKYSPDNAGPVVQ
jgi:hypothetical protein